MPKHWVFAAALIVASSTSWAIPPVQATHAVRCDVTDDPRLNRAYCLPHRAWDLVTGGHWDSASCFIQEELGVQNVRECQP